MFHDDSMRSFFRRLSFTPDGSFLLAPGNVKGADVAPQLFSSNQAAPLTKRLLSLSLSLPSAGCMEIGENIMNTTYIFSRKNMKRYLHLGKGHSANVRAAELTGLCLSGPLHTCHVRPKPRWPSAAAQSTLSCGPRRKKAKTHTGRQLADGGGVRGGYLSPVSPLHAHHGLRSHLHQMAPSLLCPTSSSCRTAWCSPWRPRTPSCCTTRSRPFRSAWWPTSTTTRSAT